MVRAISIDRLKGEALEEIGRLLAANRDITPLLYRPGERIIQEGEHSQHVYVVLEGAYRVEQASAIQGQGPSLLATVKCDPDSFSVIGEMACLGEDVRTASVYATQETRVLCLNRDHIETIIERYPKLTSVLLRQFSARLFEANRRIRELEELVSRLVRRLGLPSAGPPAST